MSILTQQEISKIIGALISSGLDTYGNRGALMQFISPRFVALLPTGSPPGAQLLSDLGRMNNVERLANGEVPLQIYLNNAALLLMGTEQEKDLRAALDQVTHRASGAPRLDPSQVPETKEKIIHRDDMVTFSFMNAGLRAAAAVMKLRVPRYENGQARRHQGNPMIYLGTGWLLTTALIMTNHHVVNARGEGEPPAIEADLKLQAQSAQAYLDFDADNLQGTEIPVQCIEAWDTGLDYAILRVKDTGRSPLRRATGLLSLGSDPIPVNIIQHPGGRGKRYAIRNNLVSATTASDIRYFTDTEGGSSGSPVFNDSWEVVGLHRASIYATNVQFQGKTTAYLNQGTQLHAILSDLQARFPAIAAEVLA